MSDSNSASPLTDLHDLVPPSAAEWFADCLPIANHDWRGGWDACRNCARSLVDERIAALPSVLPGSWQPISTAPKYTPIRLYAQGGGFYDEDFNQSGSVEGHWSDDTNWSGAFWNPEQDCWDRRDGIVPTHWQHHPAPPGAAPVLPGEREKQDAVDAPDFGKAELEYMNSNPYALALLMDYHDAQQDQADSMGAECKGNGIRHDELKERGRAIMAADIDIWSDELRRQFGFPPYRAAIDAAKDKP